jgi:hypothetical protein
MGGYVFENCNVGKGLYNRAFFLHKNELKYLRVWLLKMPVCVVGGGRGINLWSLKFASIEVKQHLAQC